MWKNIKHFWNTLYILSYNCQKYFQIKRKNNYYSHSLLLLTKTLNSKSNFHSLLHPPKTFPLHSIISPIQLTMIHNTQIEINSCITHWNVTEWIVLSIDVYWWMIVDIGNVAAFHICRAQHIIDWPGIGSGVRNNDFVVRGSTNVGVFSAGREIGKWNGVSSVPGWVVDSNVAEGWKLKKDYWGSVIKIEK